MDEIFLLYLYVFDDSASTAINSKQIFSLNTKKMQRQFWLKIKFNWISANLRKLFNKMNEKKNKVQDNVFIS